MDKLLLAVSFDGRGQAWRRGSKRDQQQCDGDNDPDECESAFALL
jgi:hypothetical protein